MPSTTMPVPTALPPHPPGDRHGGGSVRRPAPAASILAALARMTSHAGDPSSMTITGPGHAVAVSVDRPEQYLGWREMLFAAPVVVSGDPHARAGAESSAVLHGWALTVRLVGCS